VVLLEDLQGGASVAQLVKRTGRSRFAIARWLKGTAQPRLPDFLRLVDACSLRLLDFVAAFVDPKGLPSVAEGWSELEAARRATYQQPWSQAVLRCLEVEAYRELPRHEPGWIARYLGINEQQEQGALELLLKSGQVRMHRGRYRPHAEATAIDTRRDPEAVRDLRSFWAETAAARLRDDPRGYFAHNVFSVSEADLLRIRELQKSFFQQVRSIVSNSTPEQRVALLNVHLLPLDRSLPNEAAAGGDASVVGELTGDVPEQSR